MRELMMGHLKVITINLNRNDIVKILIFLNKLHI